MNGNIDIERLRKDLLDYFGYSYFRKSASQMTDNEEEIFCDDNSRLEMLERVYKGRVIPLFFIFFTILVPQLIFSIVIYESPFLTVLYSVMLVIYLSLFIGFAKKYTPCVFVSVSITSILLINSSSSL